MCTISTPWGVFLPYGHHEGIGYYLYKCFSHPTGAPIFSWVLSGRYCYYPSQLIHSRTMCTISTPWGVFLPYGHHEGIGYYLYKCFSHPTGAPIFSWVLSGRYCYYPSHLIHSRTMCTISTPWGVFLPYGHHKGIGSYLYKCFSHPTGAPIFSWVLSGRYCYYPSHLIHSRTMCTISTPWGVFLPYGHHEGIGNYLYKCFSHPTGAPIPSWVLSGKCRLMIRPEYNYSSSRQCFNKIYVNKSYHKFRRNVLQSIKEQF